PADRSFIIKAAQGSMAEVELGRLATQKGSNEAVKSFGQHMVDDHSNINNELSQLASKKKINVPKDIDPQHKAVENRLSKLSGDQFDKAYIDEMVKDHQKNVTVFQKVSTQTTDPELKAWIDKKLPTLQEHLRMAQDIQRTMKNRSK